MRNQQIDPYSQTPVHDWSSRLLIAAAAGILFLTLYPFRFTSTPNLGGSPSPFLLGRGAKAGLFANFLNVLLFIPFGFGLSARLRESGKSLKTTLSWALIAGALFSYGIEFLQLYVPPRDSGWDDIYTNSIGSVVGFLAFVLCGRVVIRTLSVSESALKSWLTPLRITAVLLIYFGIWLTASFFLQEETRLANWDQETRLLVGNEAAGQPDYIWRGRVFRLQLWDRALPDDVARELTAGEAPEQAQIEPLGAYEFSGVPPFLDRRQFLPELSWMPKPPDQPVSNSVFLDGKSWLASKSPVGALVRDFQNTNQFSVRVVCSPAKVEGTYGRIVSISRAPRVVNFNLRQEGANLFFWFRNPLSLRHSILAWPIPGVFKADQVRDILFSYDGSNLSYFIDGVKGPTTYKLGPGTGLARVLRWIRPAELEGYNYIYMILVFFPEGILLGIAARKLNLRKVGTCMLIAAAILLPGLILELILVAVSGRQFSPENIALSVCIAIAGSLWVNSSRQALVRDN